MISRLAISALVALLLAPASARALTRTVCASGCDYAAIAPALAASAPGDVVSVSPGTYSGALVVPAGVRLEATTAGTVTLQSAGATSLVTFGGAGATVAGFVLSIGGPARAFSTAFSATIEDVSMSSSSSSLDGAILYMTGGTNVVIRRSTFTNPSTSAGHGALIRATAGVLVLEDVSIGRTMAANAIHADGDATAELHRVDVYCGTGRGLRFSSSGGLLIDGGSFASCSASADPAVGGGAYVALLGAGDFVVDGTRFDRGSAMEGGGLYFDGVPGRVSRMTNVTFSYGQAASGGALRIVDGALELVDPTFTDNRTSGVGSAIAVSGSATDVTVIRGSFCENTESSAGIGSVVGIDGGTLTVRASLFGGNGGFAIEGQPGVSSITVDHSVFLRNEGGIFPRTTLSLTNSVIADTRPYQSITGVVSAGTTTIENNVLFRNSGDPTGLSSTNVVGVDPGYFAVGVAPVCSGSDLRVRTTSPLLDAGTGAADLDGTRADIGLHGGPDADPAWWVDADSDGSPRVYDCAPTSPEVHPGHIELCNDADDDCDLRDDDGVVLEGSCTAGVGLCARSGMPVCGARGVIFCDATPGSASAELCGSEEDEDCDGNIDEGFPMLGASCSVGMGACVANGMHVCASDGLSTRCDATPGSPESETCGAGDEDCNGVADDGPVCAGMSDGTSCLGAGSVTARCGCATDTDCVAGRTCDVDGVCVSMGPLDAGELDAGLMLDGAIADSGVDAERADGGVDASASDATPNDASWVDARNGDDAAPDAGLAAVSNGCSCRVGARPTSSFGALVGLVLASCLARRRLRAR